MVLRLHDFIFLIEQNSNYESPVPPFFLVETRGSLESELLTSLLMYCLGASNLVVSEIGIAYHKIK